MKMKMMTNALAVMDELILTYQLSDRSDRIINYEIPQMRGVKIINSDLGKITAVWDLHASGAIKIINKGEERLIYEDGSTQYEFQIRIVQPVFDKTRARCVREVTHLSLEEYQNQLEIKRNKLALVEKLTQLIRVNHIIGKQEKFLKLLSDFQPHSIKQLAEKIPSDDIKSLKKEVKKRLHGSGFLIRTNYPASITKSGEYQLSYFPPPTSFYS